MGALAIPTLAPFLTRIYLMQGRLHAAASLCREFLDPIKERGIRFIYTAGSMKIDLGEVLYEWNCLEEAEQHIRDGLQANEPWRNIMTDGFGLVALTRVLQAKGDYAGAMQIVEKFETRLQEHSRPREFDEDFRTLRVRVQLAGGDLQNPSHWADQIQHSEEFDLHPELYRLTLARIRLAQGRYAEVEKLLAGMAPQLAARQPNSQAIGIQFAPGRGNRRAAALAGSISIDRILALPWPSRKDTSASFWMLGSRLENCWLPICVQPLPVINITLRKSWMRFPITGQASSPAPQPAGLIEPLSGRELEVLHLMALGKTNQEIARQLIVAPGTIKAHTASIYRKLDVANRTEAVARARQLGILPNHQIARN